MKLKSLYTSSYTILSLLFSLQLGALPLHFYTKVSEPNSSFFSVKMLMPPPNTFTYTSNVCKNNPVNQLPVTNNQPPNGTYSSFPNGLVYNNSTGEIFSGPSQPGTYTITYSINGAQAVVVVAPVINPQITPLTVNICAGQSATLTVSPLGAMGYTWNTGSNANPYVITPATSGTYSVALKDSYGCNYTTQRAVTVNNAPTNVTINSPTLCAGNSTTLGIVSGTVPLGTTYLWQPGNFPAVPYQVSPTITTTYTLTLNSSGCNKTLTVKVDVSPATTPTVDFSYPFPICVDSGDPLPIKVQGFTEGGIFSSDTDPFPIDPQTGKITLNGLAPGGYNINYSIAQLGCRMATVFPSSIDLGVVTLMDLGPNVTITEGSGTVIVASNAAAYLWQPETGLNCTDCPSPYAMPMETTQYCVSDPSNGCTRGGCITVDVVCLNHGDMSVPNAFTPNNDGKNDKFCLQGWTYCVTDFKIKVFNRWGQMVYQSTDSGFCWDGTDNGQELSSGAYVYNIDATVNRIKISRKGNITIIR